LGTNFELARLREALAEVEGAPGARGQHIGSERVLRSYLSELARTLRAAPQWMPFAVIDDAFQRRMVSVSHQSPSPKQDDELASVRVQRGDVPWVSALETTRVVVVIADAGYGKSWQSRHHAALLAADALDESDVEASPIPVWMHTGDLARSWPGGRPSDAVVDAATQGLRWQGVDTRTMQDVLGDRFADPEAQCVVVVDAYDEVLGDSRKAARHALAWIANWAREGSGRQLIVTSRAAGWDEPIGRISDDDREMIYLRLGGLEEPQVRRLWQAWFDRRSAAVPYDRLAPVLAPGSSLRQFARIPLIAAFCARVAEADTVASTRSQLFEQVVRRFMARAWKSQDDTGAAAGDAEDGARLALLGTALNELAWVMSAPGQWCDAIDVGACEQVLRKRGPEPVLGKSLTFELVRGAGILTQPAVYGSRDALGAGPVSWVHRTVQEYLAARYLCCRSADDVNQAVESAWHHPPLTGVLDFALGIEGARPSPGGAVRFAVTQLVESNRDPLGYYATLVATAGNCSRADVEHVWTLYGAGLLAAENVAQALTISGTEADWTSLVGRLLGDDVERDASVMWALALCGPSGRAALRRIVTTETNAANASHALYRVDPDAAVAAVAAVEARIAAGMPVDASDANCLRDVGPATVEILQSRVREEPGCSGKARALGYTTRPEAVEQLKHNLTSSQADVRHAAEAGLSSWYSEAIDPAGFALLSEVARNDPDTRVRLSAHATLERIGQRLPWVDRVLHDLFEPLFDTDRLPPLSDMASLASRLWPISPATRKAVAMLIAEPRLLRAELREPLSSLFNTALAGDVGLSLSLDIARLGGASFKGLGVEALRGDRLSRSGRAELATTLGIVYPDDTDVLDVLVGSAITAPSLLLEGAIRLSRVPGIAKIRVLAKAIDDLDGFDRPAVELCASAMRDVLYRMTDEDRSAVREVCQNATRRALALVTER
jgi:hypothetical protein